MTQIDVSQALYAVEAAIAGRQAGQGLPPPDTVRPPYGPGVWPPNYGRVYAWRRQTLASFEQDPALLSDAISYYAGEDLTEADGSDAYAERCCAFISHWGTTYDPRLTGTDRLPHSPLILFQRQEELVRFVLACMFGNAPGLIEKSRDMGATWICVGISVWLWIFWEGIQIGWGSNNQKQIDELRNPKTIFEKMRMFIKGLPDELRPPVRAGLDLKQGMCRNPSNGSVVDGEVGNNIGRGGRARIYFLDEAAHLQQPELVEASLSGTTRCRIDLSTVSGPNTVFYRKRQAGREWSPGDKVVRNKANVFIMDWSDHPEKTRTWYSEEKERYAAQGTAHVVAREIDRDYTGATEGIVIPFAHVEAAVDAHKKLGFDDSGGWWGGLDLADEGPDLNAMLRGRGVVVKHAEEITERDPGVVARRAFTLCKATSPIMLQYDAGGGFGGSVKSEFNRLGIDEGLDISWLNLVPWTANARVLDPGEPIIRGDTKAPTNFNFFENFKAQSWWRTARIFYRTWQAVHGHEEYPSDMLISLDSSTIPQAVLTKLMRELSQATFGQSAKLKLLINKTPKGAKSPNLADALIMGRQPAKSLTGPISTYGPKVFTR